MLCFRQQSWNIGSLHRISSLWNGQDSASAYCDSRKEHLKSISDCNLFREAETICSPYFVLFFFFSMRVIAQQSANNGEFVFHSLVPRLIPPSRIIKQQLCSRSGGWLPGELCLTKAWVGVNSSGKGSLLTSGQNIKPAEHCLDMGFGAPCRTCRTPS